MTTVIQCNGNRREDFHYVDGEKDSMIIDLEVIISQSTMLN